MTKQIEIPTGAILLAELQEFGTFPAAAQRYIRRSLDIAFYRAEPIGRWSRTREEGAEIQAQMHVYQILDGIRDAVPHGETLVDAAAFFTPLVAVSAFDICAGQLTSFSAYRFLYERLIGAAARPWLPSVFSAAAAMPNVYPEQRAQLFATLGDGLTANWSRANPTFYPQWLEN